MTLNRKLIARLAAAFLAVPVLYVVSSGPVIRLTYYDPTPVVKVDTSAPLSGNPRPLTARDYFKKVETYPVNLKPSPADQVRYSVRDFYRPLVKGAEVIHLEPALKAYLVWWHVFIARTKNGHFFFVVLNSP